jgi:RNA polymerase sigma-70 factor, ECF subfamily
MPDGPAESFRSVFDRWFGDVYGYVAYRLAPDRDAAQDVTQDVFLAAYQSWESYRGDGPLLSWLRGIARRKVADHLRVRAERRATVAPGGLADRAISDQSSPDEQSLLLAQSMRMLPPEHVELLEEKYLEGLTVRQIAAKRARTEKAIESALSRARDMLRRTFQRLQVQEDTCHGEPRL